MSHTDEQDKTLDDLHDDAFSSLMWLRARVRTLRAAFDDAKCEADRVSKEAGILRDFLVQGDILNDGDRDKVEILCDHINEAYIDLLLVLEEGREGRDSRS